MPRLSGPLALLLLLPLFPAFAAETAPALKNADFSGGLLGWHPLVTAAPGVSITADKTQGHNAPGSVKLTGADDTNPWIAQGLGDLQPHAVYGAQAWAKRATGGGQAAVKLEFYDADNHYLCGYYGLTELTVGPDWTQVAVQGEAPEGAAKAAVILRLIGAGTVYFDDVTFTRVAPPPAIMLSPVRLTAPAQAGGTVTISARLLALKPAIPPTALLTGGPLPRPASLPLELKSGAGGVSFDLVVTLPADVKPGAYKLQVTWADLPPAAMDLVLLPSGQHPASLDAHGRFLKAGQPFLPLGLYHVAPADFKAVAAAGFNVAEIAPTPRLEDVQAAISAAQGLDLQLLVPIYPALTDPASATATIAMVKALASSPAVFGWLLADEPELKPAEAAAVPDLYLRVREADNTHPVLLNLGPTANLGDWAPLADALLVNLLPLTAVTPETDTPAVASRLSAAAQALAPAKRTWLGVLPAGWSGRPALTTVQARAYLYQLLAAGAEGACWFSLREEKWDLTTTPLWKDLPKLNGEAKELGAALFGGQPLAGVEVSVKALTWRAVVSGKQVHALLFNPTAQAVSGYLRVADPVTKAEWVDGGALPSVSDRTVQITVPAYGARALRLTIEPGAAKPAVSPEPEPEKPTPAG